MIICNKNLLWRALRESNIAEWFLAGEWLRRVIKKIPPYISSSYIDKVLFPPGTCLSPCVVSSFTNFIWTNFLQQPLKVNMKWSKHTLFYMDVRTHTSVGYIYKWWDSTLCKMHYILSNVSLLKKCLRKTYLCISYRIIIQTLHTIFGALVQDAKVWKVPIKV